MAHGFLTPSPVTGESKIWKEIKKQFDKLRDRESKKLDDIDKKVSQIQNLLTGADQKALPPAAATKMLSGNKTKLLGAGSGGLVTRNGGLTEKNPTNIDVKTGKKLPPGGPRLPGKKGGTFTNMGSPSPSGGLNGGNFFSKAVISGVDANTGEYLSKEARVAAFKAGRVQSVRQANPAGGITPDSGADIVAAMNRNTAAIVELVDVTKDQTKNDSNIAQEQIQAQETMLSRQAARAEEKSLEQGSDLSGFLKAETFKKKNDGQGGSGGGGGGGLSDLLGTGLDLFGRRRGRRSRVRSRPRSRIKVPRTNKPNVIRPRVNKPPGKGFKFPNLFGSKPGVKPGLTKPGFKMPSMRGLSRFSKSNALLNTLFAGMEFAGRKSEGQTNVQAGVGTAASTVGGLGGAALGAKGGAAAGAAIGALFGGVGAVPGAAIGGVLGGLLGGFGGASLLGWGADKATGADKVVPNRTGGIISKPILSLMGEGNKKEGVFPLEGKEGEKVFSNFGKGVVEAQIKAKKKFSEVQAFAMKKYFEHQGGFKMFGKALEVLFGPLIAGLKGIGGLLKNVGGGLLNTFFGGPANAGEMNTDGLASFIGGLESGNDYTKMVGGATDASVLNKTIDQLMEEKGGQFAMGRYQIQMRTAAEVLKNAGIDTSSFKFDQAGQDKIFQLLLKRRGIDDFMAGTLSKEDFAKNLSMEWAALPQDASGRGYYDDVGTNKSLTSFSSVMGQLDSLKKSGNPMRSASGNQLSDAAESLRGMSTAGGPGGGNTSCVYAVNKVFKKAGVQPPWGSAQDTLSAINGMKSAGWQEVGFANAQPGDVWVYDDGVSKGHVGIKTSDGRVLSNSSSAAAFTWSADQSELMRYYPRAGLTPAGGTFYRPPGASTTNIARNTSSNGGSLTADQKASIFRNAGMTGMADMIETPPLSAVPTSINTGNPFMATSAQLAMQNTGGGTPTVINNYYGAGGNQQQGVNPNGVNAGISMDGTGTSIFQDLKIRTLS